MDNKLVETIQAMGELHGRTLSPFAAQLFLHDLSEFPSGVVISALEKCRRDLRYFPTLAEVLERIDDGHPGIEEAWAMIPKDEAGSVVWTEEMASAFGIACSLLDADEIGARMAFREVYRKNVAESRAAGTIPKWSPSLGTEKLDRQAALSTAVAKGRISAEAAETLCPEIQFSAPKLETLGIDRATLLRQIPEVL